MRSNPTSQSSKLQAHQRSPILHDVREEQNVVLHRRYQSKALMLRAIEQNKSLESKSEVVVFDIIKSNTLHDSSAQTHSYLERIAQRIIGLRVIVLLSEGSKPRRYLKQNGSSKDYKGRSWQLAIGTYQKYLFQYHFHLEELISLEIHLISRRHRLILYYTSQFNDHVRTMCRHTSMVLRG